MKNSLMIPLIFIVNLVVWVCLLSFFSVLGTWRYLEALIDGNVKLFFLMCGYRAVFLLPLGVMLALVFVFFYLMRHRSLVLISVPLVFLIATAVVVFGLPYSYATLSALENRFPDAMRTLTTVPSGRFDPGSIRAGSDGSRWIDISRDSGAKRQVLVVKDGADSGLLTVYTDARYDSASKSLVAGGSSVVPVAGGMDPLYADYVELPRFIRSTVSDCSLVFESFRAALAKGPIPYLWGTGSFFAALMALWILCYATRWRMINVLLVAVFLRGLFFAWPLTVAGPVHAFALKFRPPFIPSEILSPCFYLAFACLLALAGLVVFFVRKIRRTGSEASYG
jgi:hypothetical protein